MQKRLFLNGGEAPFLCIYLKFWGLISEVLVCKWAQRESELERLFPDDFCTAFFHIFSTFSTFCTSIQCRSLQKEHLECCISYCSKLLISFNSMKWVEHCRAWLNILMKTWRDGLYILHLYNLFTYPSSN